MPYEYLKPDRNSFNCRGELLPYSLDFVFIDLMFPTLFCIVSFISGKYVFDLKFIINTLETHIKFIPRLK